MQNKLLTILLLTIPTFVSAEDNTLNGSVEFGYESNSGNTESKSLYGGLNGEYIKGLFRNSGEFKFNISEEEGEEDKNQKRLKLQSDYKLNKRFYLYSNFNAKTTKYSSYFTDLVVSPGIGYQVFNEEDLRMETEIGIGYRYQEPNLDEIDDDDLILPEEVNEAVVRFNFLVNWNINEIVSLDFESTITSGQSNSRYDNDFSLGFKINESLVLKIEKDIDYLNRVPPGLENKDSELRFKFVYSF
jgi:putative salt-induced outer membrane protein